MRGKESSSTKESRMRGKESSSTKESRVRGKESRTQGEGKRKNLGLSLTRAPFYFRFRVLVFLGLMVMPTTIFSLVTAYINAHNYFFIVMAYIGTHSIVLIPLTTYTLNLNPFLIHIWAGIQYPP